MAATVVVVGSTNIDLTAYVDTVPDAGETRLGHTFRQSFGGKGANQAFMAARAGAPVVFISGLGDDANGRSVTEHLERNGVDCGPSFVFDDTTGVAHIWVEASGENRIVVVPGANHRLEPAAVVARFGALDDAAVVVGQCEIPLGVTAAVFAEARRLGITTVLNPAPFLPLPAGLSACVDWLVVNEVEHAQLGSAAYDGGLVVTSGSRGAVLVDRDGTRTVVDAPSVRAVDTTGAGDALVGAFAAALCRGVDPATALRFGVRCATASVVRPGAQDSYVGPAEAESILATCLAG
jgi:ribokinase